MITTVTATPGLFIAGDAGTPVDDTTLTLTDHPTGLPLDAHDTSLTLTVHDSSLTLPAHDHSLEMT